VVIAEIQVLPDPTGTEADHYAHVDAAIAVIQASGLDHEVGALGTTLEGSSGAVWPLLQQVHEATLRAGARTTVTVIKVVETTPDTADPTIAGLTGKFRDAPS
jgi:uncharacterized protein YqgV (UPF0045/DUF77 family)